MTGINDGKFKIENGQGISQAIAKEIGLTKEQCKKVDWKSVFEIVNEAKGKEGNNVNWSGNNDSFVPANKKYVVNPNDVFEFSKEIWTRIVDVVKNSLTSKGVNADYLKPLQLDVPVSPEPYAEKDRFNYREIDGTKTQKSDVEDGKMATFFDKNGQKVKEVTLKNDNTTRETYYDTEGKVTHTVEIDAQGTIKHAEAFDKNGKKLSWQDENGEVHREGDSKVGVNIAEHHITVYNDNKRDVVLEHCNIIFEEYDEGGKKIKESQLLGDDLSYKVREYDDNNNITKETDCDDDGSVSGITEYNENGKEAIEKSYRSNGELDEEILYDTSGRKTKEIRYDDKKTTTYEYDNNIEKHTEYNEDGSINFTATDEYDNDGNCTKSTFIMDDSRFVTEYKYENGRLVRETDYDENNNVESYNIYEYDDKGNKIKNTIYNADGSIRKYWAKERDENGVWHENWHEDAE